MRLIKLSMVREQTIDVSSGGDESFLSLLSAAESVLLFLLAPLILSIDVTSTVVLREGIEDMLKEIL